MGHGASSYTVKQKFFVVQFTDPHTTTVWKSQNLSAPHLKSAEFIELFDTCGQKKTINVSDYVVNKEKSPNDDGDNRVIVLSKKPPKEILVLTKTQKEKNEGRFFNSSIDSFHGISIMENATFFQLRKQIATRLDLDIQSIKMVWGGVVITDSRMNMCLDEAGVKEYAIISFELTKSLFSNFLPVKLGLWSKRRTAQSPSTGSDRECALIPKTTT